MNRFFSAGVLILAPVPAFAYIDPASGSALLSALIGFSVAIGLTLKTRAINFKNSLLSRMGKVDEEKEAAEDQEKN